MTGRLDDKVTIITGGGGGIGRAIAAGCAREGAVVCIADLSLDAAQAVAAEIGGRSFACALDVSSQTSIDALMATVVAHAGRIDVLISTAGIFELETFFEITPESFDRVMAVNTRGLLFMMQSAARQMVRQGHGGSIVNFSSLAGRRGDPQASVYSASKAAVISLGQSAAAVLIRDNIRVNTIAPGPVQTAMWDKCEDLQDRALGNRAGAFTELVRANIPSGRIGTPADFVTPAIFLASEESAHIVGQTINIDGGLFMS